MAGFPEKRNEKIAPSSRLLHNFNLPSHLKWGHQKHLRCVKSTQSNTALYVTPLSVNPIQQTNSPVPLPWGLPITARSVSPPKINKGKSVASSSDGGTSEIEAVRQKLMRDLKVAGDEHLKVGFLDKKGKAKEDMIPVEDPLPWDLRNRQAFGKTMNDSSRFRWGHQKHLRCVKSTQSTTDRYVTPFSLNLFQQNNSLGLSHQFPITAHQVSPPKINKGKSAITSSSDGGTSEIVAARQKLISDLKAAVYEHLKLRFLEEKGKAEDEMKPVEDALPWNFHSRQAFGKTTNESAHLRWGHQKNLRRDRQARGKTRNESARLRGRHQKHLQRVKSTKSTPAHFVTPISVNPIQQNNSPVPLSRQFPMTSGPVSTPKINKGKSAITSSSYGGGTSEIEAVHQKLVSNLKVTMEEHLKVGFLEEKGKAKEDMRPVEDPLYWNLRNHQAFGKTKNENGEDLWPVRRTDRGYRSLFAHDRVEASGGSEQQRPKFSVALSRDRAGFLGDGRGKAALEA